MPFFCGVTDRFPGMPKTGQLAHRIVGAAAHSSAVTRLLQRLSVSAESDKGPVEGTFELAVVFPLRPQKRSGKREINNVETAGVCASGRRDMNALGGKTAVITGGSSGIGLATARRFAAEGAHIYIVGRRQAELEKARASLGKDVTAVQADVTSATDLDRLVHTVSSQSGAIDVIVACAGFVERATLSSASPEHFDKTFDLNARGTFFTVQKLLPLMRDGGSIVLLSSGMSCLGIPGYGAYAATKAAIRSFSRTWAAELKGRGIRVNTLSPGPVDTPMIDSGTKTKEQADAVRAMYVAMTPLGRLGRPEEIASAALFLASNESSFSTGIDVVADGGVTQL